MAASKELLRRTSASIISCLSEHKSFITTICFYQTSSISNFISFRFTIFSQIVDPPPDMSTPTTTHSSTPVKNETLDSRIFGRNRYKFLALTAIILLAFSSILTSTVTLRFSAGNLNHFSNDIAGGSIISGDFDIIEIEVREKAVKHMWDVYINDRRIKLQPFWQAAFEAAYEDLTGDVPEVREAAISEIAKMSFYSTDIDLPDLEIESTDLQLQELIA